MFMCHVWLWCHNSFVHVHVNKWGRTCTCHMNEWVMSHTCDCHMNKWVMTVMHVTWTIESWWHVWLSWRICSGDMCDCHDAFVHVNFNDLSLLQSCQWNSLVRFYFLNEQMVMTLQSHMSHEQMHHDSHSHTCHMNKCIMTVTVTHVTWTNEL
jgi:hypothetical protein